jgi:RNA polymerase sigma-70 factor (ECF subfamily)
MVVGRSDVRPEAVREASSGDLARRVIEGETEVFAEIVRRHQRDVYRVLAALLRDAAATENLVQQTFINAYQHLHQFQLDRDFGQWVKAIARNLARDEMRRSSQEAQRLGHYRDYLLALSADEDALVERERRVDSALSECWRKLAPAAARALELRYEESLDVESVAQALGRTLGATHQLLFRARAAVRECMERRLVPE